MPERTFEEDLADAVVRDATRTYLRAFETYVRAGEDGDGRARSRAWAAMRRQLPLMGIAASRPARGERRERRLTCVAMPEPKPVPPACPECLAPAGSACAHWCTGRLG